MRRFLSLLLVLSLGLGLSSCGKSDGSAEDTKVTSIETSEITQAEKSHTDGAQVEDDNERQFVNIDILYEETDNYKIYTTEDETAFVYYVYSNSGAWLDDGYGGCCGAEGIIDFDSEEGYLVLNHSSMMNIVSYKYYELDRNLVSRYYSAPCKVSGALIAHFTYKNGDGPFLIVQDIFEPSLYYKEFEWNYPSYLYRYPSSVTFEFLNNNTELKITYLNENTNEYDTVMFDLKT